MSTSRTADIVFCIDASASMAPCFMLLQKSLGSMMEALSDGQGAWDVRFDFIAHSASENGVFRLESVSLQGSLSLVEALYAKGNGTLFTSSIDEFKRRLAAVEMQADEAPLFALDVCLDFPWRDSAKCHRVVIMLTDEPFEEGALLQFQQEKLPQLMQKIQDLKVLLFMVAPDSKVFDQLSQVDKSEYEVIDGVNSGMANVDFTRLLAAIGKSVSVSNLQGGASPRVQRSLYGQADMTGTNEEMTGA
jgi:hypothetical protein